MNTATTLTTTLPLWADMAVSALVVLGALMALIGAIGLVKLPSFYARLHAPTCFAAATIVYFSLSESRPIGPAILISVFLIITAPLSAMLLIKVGLYRARRAGQRGR